MLFVSCVCVLDLFLFVQLAPALAPPLTPKDEKVVTSIKKLVAFFLGDAQPAEFFSRAGAILYLDCIMYIIHMTCVVYCVRVRQC